VRKTIIQALQTITNVSENKSENIDPDIISLVLSDLLTFLQVIKTNNTLPVEGHGTNSLYKWQKSLQKWISTLPLSNEILTYTNQYNASQAYKSYICHLDLNFN